MKIANNIKELISLGKTLNVLFIEDNNEVREQIYKLLSNFFSNIDIAKEGEEALFKYTEFYNTYNRYYDLVISDLNLPKLDGIELCSAIMRENPEQIILVISAHTESNKLMKLIEIGIYKFLQKPIQYDSFISTITKVLNKKKIEKENLVLEKEIKDENKLANLDKLTQVYNRHYLDNFLSKNFEECKRKRNIFLIFIDIDDFKKINDTHGHIIGDIILREFSKILKLNIRSEDIIGRWGGDEFIIISTNTNIDTSLFIAEKLRKIIKETVFTKDIKITSSFGVVSFEEEDSISALIKKADTKLYESKRNGKDIVSY